MGIFPALYLAANRVGCVAATITLAPGAAVQPIASLAPGASSTATASVSPGTFDLPLIPFPLYLLNCRHPQRKGSVTGDQLHYRSLAHLWAKMSFAIVRDHGF